MSNVVAIAIAVPDVAVRIDVLPVVIDPICRPVERADCLGLLCIVIRLLAVDKLDGAVPRRMTVARDHIGSLLHNGEDTVPKIRSVPELVLRRVENAPRV